MRPALRILLFALGVILPASAHALQDTCTFSASGNWSAIGTHPTASCTGGDNNSTIDADDIVVIPSGVTITVTGDITQGTTAGAGVTVQSGGSLSIEAANKSGGAGSLTLTVGDAGLDCQSGSTCTLAGGYREWVGKAGGTAAVQTDRSFFYLGDILPCNTSGEPDCNATSAAEADVTTIRWDSTADQSSGDPDDLHVDTSIKDIAATDVFCVFDADLTDTEGPVDHGACYEVDAVSHASAPYDVSVNIDQGTLDSAGYPLARRRNVQSTLTAAVDKGDRTLCIDSTTNSAAAISADHHKQGYFVRFTSAAGGEQVCDGSGDGTTCELESRGYSIMRVIEDTNDSTCSAGSDRIELADRAGIREARASGETVLIDFGWSPGDTGFFMVPVRVVCASSTRGDCPVVLDGAASITAAVFERTGTQTAVNDITVDWQDVWLVDTACDGTAQDCNNTAGRIIEANGISGNIDHLLMTGGSDQINANCSTSDTASDNCDDNHMFFYSPPSSATHATLTINDLMVRHAGDDNFVVNTVGTNGTAAITMNRPRFQFASDSSASGQGIDNFSGDPDVTIAVYDGQCIDCASSDGNGQIFQKVQTIHRFAVLGLDQGWVANDDGHPAEDILVIGGDQSGTGTTRAIMQVVDRCEVRDQINTSTGWALAGDAGTASQDPEYAIKNCIFENVDAGDDTWWNAPTSDQRVVFENIAIINPEGTGTNASAIKITGKTGTQETEIRHVALVWDDDHATTTGFERGFVVTSTGNSDHTVEGLLVANLRNPSMSGSFDAGISHSADTALGDLNWEGGGPCAYGSTLDVNSLNAEDELPASAVRGIAPGFVALALGRVDIRSGAAADAITTCGVKTGAAAPGMRKKMLMHSWMNLEPLTLHSLIPGGGGGVRVVPN